MSDPIPKPAKTTASPRQIAGWCLFLALVLMISIRAGLPQLNSGAVLNSQSVVNPPHQGQIPDYSANPGDGAFDSIVAERRMKMLNDERHKTLVSDSDKLLKLATELNNEIARSNSGSLTTDQLRKVAEIEKLARSVREKMTQTIGGTSAIYPPIAGPR